MCFCLRVLVDLGILDFWVVLSMPPRGVRGIWIAKNTCGGCGCRSGSYWGHVVFRGGIKWRGGLFGYLHGVYGVGDAGVVSGAVGLMEVMHRV